MYLIDTQTQNELTFKKILKTNMLQH